MRIALQKKKQLYCSSRKEHIMAKHPCIGCKYYEQCGNTNRTEPCEGRETKKK